MALSGALCLLSHPGPLSRPPQDISLEEFDDEDLSEITDDCGLGLSYDSDHCEKVGQGLGADSRQSLASALLSVPLGFEGGSKLSLETRGPLTSRSPLAPRPGSSLISNLSFPNRP